MKKRKFAVLISVVMGTLLLAGCGAGQKTDAEAESAVIQEDPAAEDSAVIEGSAVIEDSAVIEEEADETPVDGTVQEQPVTEEDGTTAEEEQVVRIGSLKGPTSIGLVYLMEQAEKKETVNAYDFTMAVTADELLIAMLSEELDIALIPANVASVLYNRAEGDVAVIDINTLGVLYMVTGDDKIKGIEDLKGRTVYMTGKGTTPDHVMQYLLGAGAGKPDDPS